MSNDFYKAFAPAEAKRLLDKLKFHYRLGRTIDWRFTTDDARIKLKRLYPSILC